MFIKLCAAVVLSESAVAQSSMAPAPSPHTRLESLDTHTRQLSLSSDTTCRSKLSPRSGQVSPVLPVYAESACGVGGVSARALSVQDVQANGTKQTVHVLVCTYNETAELVRECVLRLLIAPEPIYMEKIIYVCDDGHAKAEGPKKRAMVEQLQALGARSSLHACMTTCMYVRASLRRRVIDCICAFILNIGRTTSCSQQMFV